MAESLKIKSENYVKYVEHMVKEGVRNGFDQHSLQIPDDIIIDVAKTVARVHSAHVWIEISVYGVPAGYSQLRIDFRR